tara:strand:+ start:179 stop:1270 length:1092 start_codon:yes stop_codon:yes gene_type:complete
MKRMIADQKEFEELCKMASDSPWVGLDTEFNREGAYYPKLCLLQLSSPKFTVCIDPLADLDFSPFQIFLSNPAVKKIFHAARQDIEALFVAFGSTPKHLFDTQIAAQLCGYREQIAYAELARLICSVNLPKAHTRIDWSKRPLSDSEIQYALDDARFLGQIHQTLDDQLVNYGRDKWVREDCERLSNSKFVDFGSTRAIQKIQISARDLDQEGQSVVHQIAIWRETVAMKQNLPREWILASHKIILIGQILPGKPEDFKSYPMLSKLSAKSWFGDLILAVKKGQQRRYSYVPISGHSRLTFEEKKKEKVLWAKLQNVCSEFNIASAAVCSKKDIRRLIRGDTDLKLLNGWREQFIGRALVEFL